MQFETNRNNRLIRESVGLKDGSVSNVFVNQYPYSVNFYKTPPFGKISLEESEDMVAERLNILQICDEMLGTLENSSQFKRTKQYFEILENKLQNSDSKYDKNFYIQSKGSDKSLDVLNARRRDHISHFLLRIYYCRSDELKKWFISRECELLRARLFDNLTSEMLSYNDFNYEKVGEKERSELSSKINWNSSLKNSANNVVYKIGFENAIELVKTRKVYINSGFAYIMIQDMVSVICNKFRSDLSHSLALMQMSLHQLEEDERLIPRLHSLHLYHIQNRKSSVKTEDGSGREVITPEMIDTLAVESFPPCMRNINEMLRKEHHLKHYGRLHYGLFLKSCGLSLEDALRLFRDEFTQKITPEKFQKEYAYNIRYNYGKEGKKVNISPYSCQKIINDNTPGSADTHGCPFKHFDQKNLNLMLKRFGIDENNSKEILEIVENDKNYSNACSKYFSCKHEWYPQLSQGIYHPNQYYVESRKAFKMSALTPPNSGEHVIESEIQPNDMTLTSETTADTFDDSMLETEDEFDRSLAGIQLAVEQNPTVVSNSSQESDV